MRSRSPLYAWLGAGLAAIGCSMAPLRSAAEQRRELPAWLASHVGDGEGQISRTVLERAHALYVRKVGEGAVKNACYFAMDATRPNVLSDGEPGRRFYVICDAERSFRAIPAGHGSGRKLSGGADFSNGRECARNFGNAMDSELTAGGDYVTAETKPSFKGYYRASVGQDAAFVRSFIQFDGEGETANARQRAIGGHAAVTLKGVCLRKDPRSPYANHDGYVPFGTLVNYDGGRSNGCTSWSRPDAAQIAALVRTDPTTLYIFPEAADVDAVAQAVAGGRRPLPGNLYWNATCLRTIGAPRFWPRQTLEPILAAYLRNHPPPPPRPAPICKGSPAF